MARGSRRTPRAFDCPVCGGAVRAGALACPECGSDAESGWSETADSWAGDPPAGHAAEDDFDYDAFLEREGLDGAGPLSRRALRRWGPRLVVLLLTASLLAWLLL